MKKIFRSLVKREIKQHGVNPYAYGHQECTYNIINKKRGPGLSNFETDREV